APGTVWESRSPPDNLFEGPPPVVGAFRIFTGFFRVMDFVFNGFRSDATAVFGFSALWSFMCCGVRVAPAFTGLSGTRPGRQ
ncbi:hypothetical protein ACSDR0_22455, partial [Streptosporangium sp. G11]|uniref:hypothetical protein n=1 Tax=Streptosporangium sp. G11 TaxID=3436926 RepID=UPI003EBE5648